jgi:hypothetical protein
LPITPFSLIWAIVFFFLKKENIVNPYRIFDII